jgi:hypothetical protein
MTHIASLEKRINELENANTTTPEEPEIPEENVE